MKRDENPSEGPDAAPEGRGHALGPESAAAVIVEYGDYECPYCAEAHQVMKDVLERFAGRVRYVYRHFPLTRIHPYAQQAAEAAEAAGAQGKFWEMHELLFENQHALDDEALVSCADSLGLDVERFIEDLNEHRFARTVEENLLGGLRGGVDGTPTFYLNGIRLESTDELLSGLGTLEEAA